MRRLSLFRVVVVRVTLDQDGRVRDSAAISGPESLIADCIANSKKWRFQAGSGKTAVILYQFKIEGLCISGCPSLPNVRMLDRLDRAGTLGAIRRGMDQFERREGRIAG
jgi:hypothetical protein